MEKRWTLEHQQLLEKLLREKKSINEIAKAFDGIFAYSTITARVERTKSGEKFDFSKSADSQPTGIKKKWEPEETKTLQRLYANGVPYDDMVPFFVGRSRTSIKNKITLLVKEGVIPQKSQAAVYTADEDARFNKLWEQKAPVEVFYKEFPNRSNNAIYQRFCAYKKRNFELSGEDILSAALNWALFKINGIFRLTREQWPLSMTSSPKNSALYLISRDSLSPLEKGAVTIRNLISEIEKEKLTGARFYFAEDRGNYLSNLPVKKGKKLIKRTFANTSQQNLVYASVLADGHLKANKTDFEIGQAATLLVKGSHSHLEYLLSIFFKFSDNLLTAVPLELRQGLRYKERNATDYAWKINFTLCNFDSFEEIRKDNYFESPKKTPEEEETLNALSAEILKRSGAKTQSVESALDFPEAALFEVEDPKRELKNLPLSSVLLAKYFQDPGLTIAHIYQQDGSLINPQTCCLFIQTLHFDRACRLARCIFIKTTLRFFPKAYYWEKQKRMVTILQLCQDDNAKFLELTAPHWVDCMNYKRPAVLNPKDIGTAEKKVRESHLEAFDYLYKNFVDSTI